MKLERAYYEGDVEVIGSSPLKSGTLKIAAKNTPFFVSLLTKVYSDRFGSIVREITSNAFDAHQKAGVDEPVIIRHYIDTQTNQEFIEFVDQGTGLSPEAMDEIYMSLGESDKRESNEFLGAFGLGSKSPFCYTPYFYVITKVNGTQYFYLLNETEAGITNDLLDASPCDAQNGTIIRIPLIQGSHKGEFSKALHAQLKYFANVFVFGFNDLYRTFNNNFTIVESYKTFKYRPDLLQDQPRKRLHVALGPVNYPIDFEVLGYAPINLNVALKFEVGELDVILNREQLKYTDRTIAALKAKIDAFIEEFRSIILIPENLTFSSIRAYVRQHAEISNNRFRLHSVIGPFPLKNLDLSSIGSSLLQRSDCNPSWSIGGYVFKIGPKIFQKGMRHGYTPALWKKQGAFLTSYKVQNVFESRKDSHPLWGAVLKNTQVIITKALTKVERAYLNDNDYQLVSYFKPAKALLAIYKEILSTHYNIIPLEDLKVIRRKLEEELIEVINDTHTYLEDLKIPEDYGKTHNKIERQPDTLLIYNLDLSNPRMEIKTVSQLKQKYIFYGTKNELKDLKKLKDAWSAYPDTPKNVVFVYMAQKYLSAFEAAPNAYTLQEVDALGLKAPWWILMKDSSTDLLSTYKTVELLNKQENGDIPFLIDELLEPAVQGFEKITAIGLDKNSHSRVIKYGLLLEKVYKRIYKWHIRLHEVNHSRMSSRITHLEAILGKNGLNKAIEETPVLLGTEEILDMLPSLLELVSKTGLILLGLQQWESNWNDKKTLAKPDLLNSSLETFQKDIEIFQQKIKLLK